MQSVSRNTYHFDEFELDAQRRLLFRQGQPITLRPKAFELLLILVASGGRLLTKNDLLKLLWPDQIVEESNLTVHMATLRKALGERKGEHRFVLTEPGRGYRFIANVQSPGTNGDQVAPDTESVNDTEWKRARASGYADLDGEENLLGVANVMTRVDDQVWRLRRLHISLIGLVLAGLLGVAGFWVYHSRTQTRQMTASSPPQQITIRRFTTTGGFPVRVAISPDGKSVFYLQLMNGKSSLWLGQLETSSSVLIHQEPDTLYQYLNFAPDGSHLYFTTQNGTKLMRMPIVGGATTQLLSNVHSAVTFSPDAERIAFVRKDLKTRQAAIMIADAADGKNERTIVHRSWPGTFSSGLSWSPDGNTIAIGTSTAGRRDEILSVSVADGVVKKIGDRDWAEVSNVAWLADGTGLIFIGRDREQNNQIWRVSYPGGEARKITNDLNHYQGDSLSLSADGKLAVLHAAISPSIWIAPNGDARRSRAVLKGTDTRQEGLQGLTWTPDGRLLYVASVGDSHTIWEMSGEGNEHRQVIPHHANAVDSQMRVTADGRYMVFQSDRSGSSEIWRANIDGSELKQLTEGGSNSEPSLSPDGSWVIYTSERAGKPTLWRVPSAGGKANQISERPASFPQVSPHGKHIVCIS